MKNRAIRNNEIGEIIITINKNDNGAECIKEALLSKLEHVKTRVASTQSEGEESMTLNIRNLDVAINAKELEVAIIEALLKKTKVMRISELRPTYGDTQSANCKTGSQKCK